jgi:hypothetical protein
MQKLLGHGKLNVYKRTAHYIFLLFLWMGKKYSMEDLERAVKDGGLYIREA